MSASDLREAFNSVASPSFTCSRALLSYERENGVEWQRLTFYGNDTAGVAFEIMSDRIPPSGDVTAAARATAQRQLDQ